METTNTVTTRRPRTAEVRAPGTDAAFEALFADEYPAMIRLAFVMLGSQEQAEDVVHDSMAKLIERWNRIENPGGYLRTSVVNGARSVLRRRRFLHRQPPRDLESNSPEIDYLTDVLDVLSPTRRAIVTLRYFEQLTIPEIADVLGIREGTVKSGLHRSLRALRQEFTP